MEGEARRDSSDEAEGEKAVDEEEEEGEDEDGSSEGWWDRCYDCCSRWMMDATADRRVRLDGLGCIGAWEVGQTDRNMSEGQYRAISEFATARWLAGVVCSHLFLRVRS